MYSRSIKGKNLVGLLVSMLVSICIILIHARIWEIDISLPVAFNGDVLLGGALVKSVADEGIRGLWFCSRLGAPEISTLVDTPFLDLRMGLEFFALTRVFSNPWTCYYLHYFYTYAFCTLTMYLLINRYTDRVWLKVLLSISYAIIPYHFIRGMGHQTLSCYFVVPIIIYIMDVVYCESFQGIVPQRYKGSWWKSSVLYLGCVIVGISNIYYAYFGMICIAIALMGKTIKTKRVKLIFQDAIPLYSIILGVVIGLLPKIVYSIRNGLNHSAGVRVPMHTEIYGLKIIQLLLPCSYNKVDFLAQLNSDYSSKAFNINENSAAALGIIATIGFLIACEWVIWRIVKHNSQEHSLSNKMDVMSLAILVLVLFSTTGGFGTIVSYWITPELRALNRVSVVIAGLSICILCCALDYVIEKAKTKLTKRGIVSLMTMVFVFALYSEVPMSIENWQVSTKKQNDIYASFFQEVESAVEPSSMIYELPHMQFPESPAINNMYDYQPALGYIYTNTLRWSYGGMRGRNHIAEELAIDNGQSYRFVKGIKQAGFSGILIDTTGFSDGGSDIIRFYSEKLQLNPIISSDGQMYFFNILSEELDTSIFVNGYEFIETYAALAGKKLETATIASYAEKLKENDTETINELWSWLDSSVIDESHMNNTDYVRFLYNHVIGRDEEYPEGWSSKLDNGLLTRKDIFHIFITSDEFKSRNGYSQ